MAGCNSTRRSIASSDISMPVNSGSDTASRTPDVRRCASSTSKSAPFRGKALPIACRIEGVIGRSEEHTSELQSLMRHSYAVFCLKKKKTTHINQEHQSGAHNTDTTHTHSTTTNQQA